MKDGFGNPVPEGIARAIRELRPTTEEERLLAEESAMDISECEYDLRASLVSSTARLRNLARCYLDLRGRCE